MALRPERLVTEPERIEPLVPPTVTTDELEVPVGPILEADEPGATVPGCDPITPRSEMLGVTDPNRSAVDAGEFD